MDDYGGTFFDLNSAPSYYGSSLGYSNDIAPTPTTHNSYFNEVNDLDSLLLPTSENDPGVLATNNSFQDSVLPQRGMDQFNGQTAASTNPPKSIKVEPIENSSLFACSTQSSSIPSFSIDNLMDTRTSLTTVSPSVLKTSIKAEPGVLKTDHSLSNLSVPRIIRLDGTSQTLTAGSKIQIQGLPAGQKVIKVCVASKSNLARFSKQAMPISYLQQNTLNLNSANIKLEEVNVKTEKHLHNSMTHDLDNPDHLRIIISNVVSSFRVRCHLSLRRIALDGVDVVYRKESQKIVMRLRKPKCTAYVWSSGKVVCTGAVSNDASLKGCRKIARRLQRMGFKVRFSEYKVVNVLAVSKMPYAIDINQFSQAYRGKHCSYEPELHPGVTYRIPELKATLKIFSTGSVTVTARSVQKAQEAVKQVYPTFKPFYKKSRPNFDVDCDDALPSDSEDLS